jgi:ABC-2 type transport system ATP-binding protein
MSHPQTIEPAGKSLQAEYAGTDAGFAVRLRNVMMKYGDTVALDGLTFGVRCGSIFGLIGSNGAGKTSTIGCLCGLLDAGSGDIEVFGEPFRFESIGVKRRIGVMPEGLALFDELLPHEFLEFNARAFGLDRETARSRSLELLDFLDLTPALSRPLGEFSAGMRRKMAFAAAVVHRPDLLLLDEPFANMDPAAASMLKEWLRRYVRRAGTVLITSHALDTIERFCDEVALIDSGRIIWHGDVSVLTLGGVLQADGRSFRTLESLFLHLVGYCSTGPEWL